MADTQECRRRGFSIGLLECRLIRLAGLHGGVAFDESTDVEKVVRRHAITLKLPDVSLLLDRLCSWIYTASTLFVIAFVIAKGQSL